MTLTTSRYRSLIFVTNDLPYANPETSTCEVEVPRDVTRKLQSDFVCDNGVVEVSLLNV